MIKLLHVLAYCAAALSLFACGNQTFEKSVENGNPIPTPTPTSTPPLGAPTPYGEVNLNWDAPQPPSPSPSPSYSWDPPTGYHVFRGTVSGGPYTQIGSVNVPTVTYQDAPLSLGSTYFYVVTAFDAEGNQSPYSNEAAVTIPTSLPAGSSRYIVQIKAN